MLRVLNVPKLSLLGTRSNSNLARFYPKVQDGFVRDKRTPGERELVDARFLAKDKEFRVEIADSLDYTMLTKFMGDSFVKRVGMAKSLNTSYREAYPLVSQMVSNGLDYGMSPLIFDGDKLVGAYAVSFFDRHSLRNQFPFDPKIRASGQYRFKLKEDYAADVQAGPLDNEKANCIYTCLNEIYSQCGNLLPADCQSLAFGELVTVHEDYKGYDLMNELCKLVEHLAVTVYSADYFGAISISPASIRISEKRNRQLVAAIPFNEFKVNGCPVFDKQNENDAAGAYFKILKLNKH